VFVPAISQARAQAIVMRKFNYIREAGSGLYKIKKEDRKSSFLIAVAGIA
jgi:hypothetical protein